MGCRSRFLESFGIGWYRFWRRKVLDFDTLWFFRKVFIGIDLWRKVLEDFGGLLIYLKIYSK